MGLDQYGFRVKANAVKNDLSFVSGDDTHSELYYWRKVPRLQGWMENLYREKGGTKEFNCEFVRLEEDDLDKLEADVKNHKMPETVGFFFGCHYEEDMESVLDFIEMAREVIRQGDAVYYSSWW